MDQEAFDEVEIPVGVGSMTPAEIQDVLDDLLAELADPESEASRESASIGVSVESLNVREDSAFVAEAFLIAMGVKFAYGAATAGGALFFNRIIKPRITREKADGVGDVVEPVEPEPDA